MLCYALVMNSFTNTEK